MKPLARLAYKVESCARSTRRVFAAALLTVVACRNEPTTQSFREVVRISGNEWAALPVTRLRLVEEICGRGSKASGCRMLLEPTRVFALDSSLFVFDKRQGLVELSPAGAYIRSWGDLGEYPNGYRDIAAIGRLASGGLAVWDPFYFQVTKYDGRGAVEGRLLLRHGGLREWKNAEEVLGAMFAAGRFLFLTVPQAESIGAPVHAQLWATDTSGLDPRPLVGLDALSRKKAGSDLQPPAPFIGATPIWTATPAGNVWYVPPDTLLRIQRYGRSGDPQVLVSTDVAAVALTRAEQDAGRDREIARMFKGRFDIGQLKECAPQQKGIECATFFFFDSSARLTKHYPLVTEIVSSGEGAWLREQPVAGADSVGWTYLSESGKPVRRIMVPARAQMAFADSTFILLTEKNAESARLRIFRYAAPR